MTTYSIGIDTGGTYTDAVIVNTQSQLVIATAKALTTKGDLSLGIIQALEKVLSKADDSFDRTAISVVCLSTTLATNALVEGQGSKVGVFLIGFDDAMVARSGIAQNIESTEIFRLAGGHIYTGKERAPLALDRLDAILNKHADKLDAYAVTARYATRNIAHERLVQKIIREKTGRPVSASCELSNSLNDPLRALTTTLNARIISLITGLESAVKTSLRRLEIDARIMIVKGDGSIGSADAAVLKPIETILSGPAASVIGAQFLTGLSDFAIADIGGTTSDIATIKNGWPTLAEKGAIVGGFHTLVRAVDIHTVGLGGDSEVLIDKSGRICLGKNRVVPISLLASKWPWIEQRLETALSNKRAMYQASQYIILPEGKAFSVSLKNLSDKDQQFLALLDSQKPRHYYEVVGGATDRACLSRLLKQGIVQISGVTPSDAAHVLGLQSQWSAKAAALACELLGRSSGN
ncbi:MAG: hydantoinase/oxoprolinase family protein, partial [Methylococcales bacterium]|nr:hydantoinase/oxoprolinase family protein [Methylococcales bacterium]